MLNQKSKQPKPVGRPRTETSDLVNRAIVILRSCGFTSIQCAYLLKEDRRNQERVYKRDFIRYFPEAWDCFSKIHEAAITSGYVNK